MAKTRKRTDVLVLGAGAAGLAAARDLSHEGLRVTLIEARPRIGGRVLTLHDSRSPVPLELGAEFVHGEAPETLEVAQAAGLAVIQLPDTHEIASGGRFTPMGNFWETMDRMNRDLARRIAQRRKDFPVSEYLESGRLPPKQRGLMEDFVNGFYAAHPGRISAKSLAAEAESGGSSAENAGEDKQFRIGNGGDALMRWLRDGLNPERTELRLSTIAEVVRWRRGGATVECRGGDGVVRTSLSARALVVTLPHAILKAGALRFDPPLPAKERALAGLETGHIFKIVLRFRKPFWDEAEFLQERRGSNHARLDGATISFIHAHGVELPTWWTSAPVRSPVLTGWVGGLAAEALLSEEPASRLERSLVALSEVLAVPRRELEEQLDAWVSHDWRADPFARGAYSYVAVGGTGAPRALGRPVDGTLFFAGEATSGDQIGTVAGALASGRRAAREVLRALS
jgi:monoamine oxidase